MLAALPHAPDILPANTPQDALMLASNPGEAHAEYARSILRLATTGDSPIHEGDLDVVYPRGGGYARIVDRRPESATRGQAIAYVQISPSGEHQITFSRGTSEQLRGDLRPARDRIRVRGGAHRRFFYRRGSDRDINSLINVALTLRRASVSSRRPNEVSAPPGERGTPTPESARRASAAGGVGTPVAVDGHVPTAAELRPGASGHVVQLEGMATGDPRNIPDSWDEDAGLTFGVEIETRAGEDMSAASGYYSDTHGGDEAVQALRAAGLPTQDFVPSYEDSYGARTNAAAWAATTDPSAASGPEVRTPPLVGDAGHGLLRRTVRALRDAGLRQGQQRYYGTHVHVGVRNLDGDQLDRVQQFWENNWRRFDELVARGRRPAGYAGGTMSTVGYGHENALNTAMDHGTYEIRRLGSSVEVNLVDDWVRLMKAMVIYCKSHDGQMPSYGTLSAMIDDLGLPADVKRRLLRRAERVARR